MMLRRRKKQRHWMRFFTWLCIFVLVIGGGIRWYARIGQYVESAWLVVRKPDVAAALRLIRHDNFGMLCIKEVEGADDCYMFDKGGVVFGSARMVVGDVIVRVDDVSDFKPVLGAMLIDADTWKNMAPIIAYAANGLPAGVMALSRAERELTVTLSESGTRLYFNLRLDPAEHIRALKELTKTIPLISLQYADLRVKGRVFYK
jgi:hypothetical protein